MIYTEFDSILVDYNLGLESGLQLVDEYQNQNFIMMTSYASKDVAINALNSGVKKFIEKPFTVDELEECILQFDNKIRFEGYEVHDDTSLIIKDGKITKLTITELKLLKYFFKNRNRLIEKEELQNHLWSGDVKVRNNLSTHITNLKNKVPPLKDSIEAIRSRGYLFKI